MVPLGALLYEIRHKMAERMQGREEELLKNATLTLHPENFADFLRDLNTQDLNCMFTDPPIFMGLAMLTSTLAPQGFAVVISRNSLIATADLDEGTILFGDLHLDGKVTARR